jgi:hypothetical protein
LRDTTSFFLKSTAFQADLIGCDLVMFIYVNRPIAKMTGLPDNLTETPDQGASGT